MTEKTSAAEGEKPQYSAEVRLAAWEKWKAFCCVGALKPDSEPMRECIRTGQITQSEAQTEFDFLSAKINSFWYNAVKKKTTLLSDLDLQNKIRSRFIEGSRTELFVKFDEAIHEMSPREETEPLASGVWKKVKKDKIWQDAAASDDPLGAIEGETAFLALSVLPYCIIREIADVSGTPLNGWNVPTVSFNDPLSDDQPTSLQDIVEDESAFLPNEAADAPPLEIIGEITGQLTKQEKIMFVARCAGCNITEEAVLNALHLKKTSASTINQKLEKDLVRLCTTPQGQYRPDEWLQTDVLEAVRENILEEMRQEKDAAPFFSMMNTQDKGGKK